MNKTMDLGIQSIQYDLEKTIALSRAVLNMIVLYTITFGRYYSSTFYLSLSISFLSLNTLESLMVKLLYKEDYQKVIDDKCMADA